MKLTTLSPYITLFPVNHRFRRERKNVERGKGKKKKKEKKRKKKDRKEVTTFGRFDRDERRVFAVPLSICIRGGWPTYLLTVPPLFAQLFVESPFNNPYLVFGRDSARFFLPLRLMNVHANVAIFQAKEEGEQQTS